MAEEKTDSKTDSKGKSKFAIVRIRSAIQASFEVKDTFKMLNLDISNSCAIVDDTPSVRGMLNKVKDFATFGPVSDETLKALEEKRGKSKVGNSKIYTLHPPRGGFERKGIKKPFYLGGALGIRDSMDSLLMRML